MVLVEYNAPSRFAEMFNHSEFSERLYFSFKENNIDIPYGVWHSKFLKNGLIKIVKALGLYKVVGRGENKKIMIHPRLKLIIDSTCGTNEEISKTIFDLVNGVYIDLPNFEYLDLESFNKLPDNDVFSTKAGYGTYIIENKNTKLYKIGRTRNIVKRLYDLKKEHGKELELISFKSDDIEQFLHEMYKMSRVYGEWFDLSFDDVLDISNEYEFEFNKTV